MKIFTICQTYETYTRIKCKEIVVDQDGVLLARIEHGVDVAMFKEWSYWVEEGYEVIE